MGCKGAAGISRQWAEITASVGGFIGRGCPHDDITGIIGVRHDGQIVITLAVGHAPTGGSGIPSQAATSGSYTDKPGGAPVSAIENSGRRGMSRAAAIQGIANVGRV